MTDYDHAAAVDVIAAELADRDEADEAPRTVEQVALENIGTRHQRRSSIEWRAIFAARLSRSDARKSAWAAGLPGPPMNRAQRRALKRRKGRQ